MNISKEQIPLYLGLHASLKEMHCMFHATIQTMT